MYIIALAVFRCLYGLDNFYYRRSEKIVSNFIKGLYGLDNFYYRRFVLFFLLVLSVYTDLIISTIVDLVLATIRLMMSIRT